LTEIPLHVDDDERRAMVPLRFGHIRSSCSRHAFDVAIGDD
jgi:hypothetical protein